MSDPINSEQNLNTSVTPIEDAVAETGRNRISNLKILKTTWQYMRPYTSRIALASVALILTAGLSLGLVQIIRVIVDSGFVAGSHT